MHFRSLLAVIIVGISICSPAPADDGSQLFDGLTSHEWRSDSPGRFGHQESLRLRRNGEYHWQRTSDYTERDDKGSWNITLAKDLPALLRLSVSGEVTIRIEKDKLFLGRHAFERGERITYGEKESKLGLADLKPVKPSDNFQKLTSTTWVKTNPFDDYRLPQQMDFDAGGGFSASYRDGACRTKGAWQLIVERQRIRFAAYAEENECDLRGGTAGLPSDYLNFVDGLLLLGAPYAPIDKRPKRNVFIFDPYGNSVRTQGEFDGSFTKGRAVRIDLTHESANGAEFKLVTLDIGFQKCEFVKRGVSAIGKMESVIHQDLTGTVVGAKIPHRHTVEFTPPMSGPVFFQIRLKYGNTSQPFDAPQTYVMEVREK